MSGARAHSGCKAHTRDPSVDVSFLRVGLLESAALSRGKPHERLNMITRPIANKYREGKLQRTLKREFPLASSCSSIVHHLSGPNVYALSPPLRHYS